MKLTAELWVNDPIQSRSNSGAERHPLLLLIAAIAEGDRLLLGHKSVTLLFP